MRRLSLLVSVVVILAGSLAFGRVAPETAAQDATPDAPLIAVEEVVPEATYNGFDPAEQQLWHSNVVEAAAGSDPNRPAPSLAEAEAAAADGASYGKLILLWDPTEGDLPTGQPRVIYPHGTEPGTPTP